MGRLATAALAPATVATAVAMAVAVPAAGARSPAAAGPASRSPAAAVRSSWSRPFRIASPVTVDIFPAQIAFSPQGGAAIGFGVYNMDAPSVSSGFAARRSRDGRLGRAARVPRAGSILSLSFAGSAFELLSETTSQRVPGAGSAALSALTPGGTFGAPRTLAGNLMGTVSGRVLTLGDGGALAAIAADNGVWASQSRHAGRLPAAHRLTPAGTRPQALAVTALGGDRSAVAWTAGATSRGSGPRSIFVTSGPRLRAPGARSPAVTVPGADGIDELGLMGRGAAPTAAWIESGYDRSGRYRSSVVVADLTRGSRAHALAIAGQDASGLSVAADPGGDQVLAWKSCSRPGTCAARVSTRPRGGGFGPPLLLGAIDATQSPVATVSPTGEVLVGRISGGRVLVSPGQLRTGRFGPTTVVSDTSFAADLALTFGPRGEGLAAWTQGTLFPSVVGAVYRAP